MHGHDMTVSQMHWQPPLIKLTQVANPDHDDGKETPCFICPQSISMISRALRVSSTMPTEGQPTDKPLPWGRPFVCTQVIITASLALYVTETPEQIAMMRDKALGHAPKLGAV